MTGPAQRPFDDDADALTPEQRLTLNAIVERYTLPEPKAAET